MLARCILLILTMLLHDSAGLLCVRMQRSCDVAAASSAEAEDSEGVGSSCCGEPATCERSGERTCEIPRPVPRECDPRCCLLTDQGAGMPPEKVEAAKRAAAVDVVAAGWTVVAAGPRARAAPTRSGLPEISSRMRRSVLCIRTI